jgi:hypothetical protein
MSSASLQKTSVFNESKLLFQRQESLQKTLAFWNAVEDKPLRKLLFQRQEFFAKFCSTTESINKVKTIFKK